MKTVRSIFTDAMDSNFSERNFLVNLIAGMMTHLGMGMIFLGSLHLLSSWTTTDAVILSSIGFATILAYGIFSFTLKCTSYSKSKAVNKGGTSAS